ncbi:MAG: energy-coupling factor transporter transmembrane protein EcfT [Defluviitaleaceae bacterium]|nr:energy-coupling factor transporter transmembrane protein EcfT [Defluviitaleaceae bacterium]
MNFKITLGQYYPVHSPIHSLDPRVKLIATINFIVVLFIASTVVEYAIIAAFLFGSIKIANVPIMFVMRGVRALMYIIAFTMILNTLFAPGETVLVQFWRITITLEALQWAIQMSVRLIMLLISSSVLTLTTSPISLTGAIESLLGPFKKINAPVHEIAMMMTIALRFIPTLLEEMDKITKAQMARGAGFDTGSISKRVKNLIPVLVPLFVSAFRRADELAMAMDARCYRGDVNRTKMNELMYTKADFVALCFIFLLTAVILIV